MPPSLDGHTSETKMAKAQVPAIIASFAAIVSHFQSWKLPVCLASGLVHSVLIWSIPHAV